MAERKKAEPDCNKCMFRSNKSAYRCNYCYLMGHTRKAQPPERCTFYAEGPMLETPEQAKAYFARKEQQELVKGEKKKRPQYDWGKAAALHAQGKNDGEIAREIGTSSITVWRWRERNGLPPNAKAGWPQAGRTGQDRTGQAVDVAGKEAMPMKKETKDKILFMLRRELENRKEDLDRVLKQGDEGKLQLCRYKETLLALDDFEEATEGHGAGQLNA